MPKKLYKDAPADFAVCLRDDCPLGEVCLRRQAYPALLERALYFKVANPSRCMPGEACPYFRDATPLRYARGFKGMQQRMFPAQYAEFMMLLQGKFGRNPYYERRRGDVALSPSEQETVRRALRRVGVAEDLPFDSYEECISWFD